MIWRVMAVDETLGIRYQTVYGVESHHLDHDPCVLFEGP